MHTVLLVHPHPGISVDRYSSFPSVPAGVLLVGTALHHVGYRVKIIDQRIEKDWKLWLSKTLKGDVICLGISCIVGDQISNGLEIAKFVRTRSTIPIVWGGVHPTLLPEQTLENEFVDIIVRGEGEETVVELMKALEDNEPLDGIPGISYKENGKIVHNRDREFINLDTQPPPCWELIDIDQYTSGHQGYRSVNITTSRGCPFNCGYCYVKVFHKRRWRSMSVDNVLERMTSLMEKYAIDLFQFNDEEFLIDLKRGRELVEAFKKLNIRWKANIRIDTVLRMDDAFLELMRESGCIWLGIGVESGSNNMLNLMNKKITREDVLEANRRLARHRLRAQFFFMVGFPTETWEDMKASVSLALQIKRENEGAEISAFSLFIPYPGCELHDLAVVHGLEPPDCLEKWATFNYTTDHAVWFSEEMRSIVRILAFASTCLNDPVNTNPPFHVKLMGRLYRPLARQRIKHLFFRYPLEISIAKWLGVY